jgi:hypothetical protein
MSEERPYSVFLKHRPRRIAFLLDPDHTEGPLLDEIVNFNVDSWGGRYNPIVPLTNKAIYPDYWRFLALADPDVIYCFHEIDQLTVEKLDRKIGPVLIQSHRDFGADAPIRISVEHQASTKSIILRLRELFPHFWKPEPSLLTFAFDRGDPNRISPFIRRNFGVSSNAYFLARDHGVPATCPSPSNADVLHSIGTVQNLVLPIGVCRHAPLSRIARVPYWPLDFTIYFGESAWNFIHFWNDAYFRDANNLANIGIDQMWLPPKLLEDKGSYDNLLRVITRRVYSGNQQRGLKILSYDHDVTELDALTKRLCSDLRFCLYPRQAEKLEKGTFPAFEAGRPLEFRPQLPRHEHVRGKRVFLDIEKPEEVSSEGSEFWMVDLMIEDSFQEPFFANTQPWWKLPKRASLARVFTPPRPSRVIDGGELAIQVGNKEQKVPLSIPSKVALFECLLSPRFWYTSTSDLRHAIARPASTSIRLSDKGKYLNGVLGLFPSLRDAVYFLEHPFWCETLTRLCCPQKSDQVGAKAIKTILREAEAFVRDFATDKERAAGWLAEMVLQAGEKIPGIEGSLCYADLEKTHESYIEHLSSPEEKEHASRGNLKAVLSDLTQAGVLLQGSDVRCEYCLSEFWYHVDELGKTIACRGCRREIPLQAESAWSYRPNELLRKGLREYGLLPVVRLIGRLFEKSQEDFIFLAGAELGNYEGDRFVPKAEIDLSWILDGEFGIAEVKSSTKGFSTSDLDKLVTWARVAYPKKVLLAATEGEDTELGGWRDRISGTLEPLGVQVEAWGPSLFTVPSHYLI